MDEINLSEISGDLLRRERLRRRIALTDVEAKTKIRLRYLDAIENDDFGALPPPVFAMGFISTYALFLDLRPEPFVDAYKAKLGDVPTAIVRPESSHGPRVVSFPSIVVIVIIVGFLVALTGYLYQQMAAYASGSASPAQVSVSGVSPNIPTPLPSPPPPPPQTTPTVGTGTKTTTLSQNQPAKNVAATPTATPKLPPTPTFPATSTPVHGVKIDATASGRVWVQVQTDGKVAFSGIMTAGEHRSWTATKSIMVWAGNAGYVSVVYNGKNLGPLGPPGEVLKVTWTATA